MAEITIPTVENPMVVQARQEVQRATILVDDLMVTNQEDYDFAASQLRTIKALANSVEDQRKTISQPLRAAVEAVNSMFRPFTEQLTEAERIVKNKMLTWRQAEDKKREAALRAQAEEQKLQREQAEKERQAALEAGDDEAVAQAEAKAEMVAMTPLVAPAPVQSSGTAVRKTWKGEITDIQAFLAEAIKPGREQLLACVDIKQGDLNAIVRLAKGKIEAPGLRVYEDHNIAVRG